MKPRLGQLHWSVSDGEASGRVGPILLRTAIPGAVPAIREALLASQKVRPRLGTKAESECCTERPAEAPRRQRLDQSS